MKVTVQPNRPTQRDGEHYHSGVELEIPLSCGETGNARLEIIVREAIVIVDPEDTSKSYFKCQVHVRHLKPGEFRTLLSHTFNTNGKDLS